MDLWAMNKTYKFRNDLKTGTGIKRFFQPKNTDVLSAPQNYLISDDKIPTEIKQKNLNLAYSPQSYIITQNSKCEVVLVDIRGQEVELPQTLASFRDGEIPEIRINGYALFIDINTRNNINNSSPEIKKKQLSKVGKIFSHFNKINSTPLTLSVAHELKHLSNRHRLKDICGDIEHSGLDAQQFALTRYADEISATTQELLNCVNEYNQSHDQQVFPPKFEQLVQQINSSKNHDILHNPIELTKFATQIWLNSPTNEIYTGKSGDFVAQTNQYAEKAQLFSAQKGQENFDKIIKAYLTISFAGKDVDCSQAISTLTPSPYIYEDASEVLAKRQEKQLSPSHCARQMSHIKTK